LLIAVTSEAAKRKKKNPWLFEKAAPNVSGAWITNLTPVNDEK